MKRGRPQTTEGGLDMFIKLRISAELNERLAGYAVRHSISKSEVLRKGAELILESEQEEMHEHSPAESEP